MCCVLIIVPFVTHSAATDFHAAFTDTALNRGFTPRLICFLSFQEKPLNPQSHENAINKTWIVTETNELHTSGLMTTAESEGHTLKELTRIHCKIQKVTEVKRTVFAFDQR